MKYFNLSLKYGVVNKLHSLIQIHSAHFPAFREKLHSGKRASLKKSWTQSPILAFHSVNPCRSAGQEHFIPYLKLEIASAKSEFHLMI